MMRTGFAGYDCASAVLNAQVHTTIDTAEITFDFFNIFPPRLFLLQQLLRPATAPGARGVNDPKKTRPHINPPLEGKGNVLEARPSAFGVFFPFRGKVGMGVGSTICGKPTPTLTLLEGEGCFTSGSRAAAARIRLAA
jgi:hypothetical protein